MSVQEYKYEAVRADIKSVIDQHGEFYKMRNQVIVIKKILHRCGFAEGEYFRVIFLETTFLPSNYLEDNAKRKHFWSLEPGIVVR